MGIPVPDGPDGEMAVRAAGSRAGAGVIDVGHQRVGRGADHGLQVDAGIRDRRDGQRSFPAHPRRQSGTGETGHWREKTLFSILNPFNSLYRQNHFCVGFHTTHYE